MGAFWLNGDFWRVDFCDPSDSRLIDRTGRRTVATTDPEARQVLLSLDLRFTPKLERVLVHEIGHCAMVSFGLIEDIHDMVDSSRWVEVEEWCCNLLADYGSLILRTAYGIMGAKAWDVVPVEIERSLAGTIAS